MSESEEIENKIWQQTRLFEYLNCMPIVQLMVDNVEADDVISAVVQSQKYREYQKVIVSSDKDFYQLCDDQTIVFRPVQKEVLNKNYTIVNSLLIATSERPEVKIDWRVYTKNPEKPLIRDLIVEGLSLARTQKEEFNSVIQSNNGNINALFINLENFIKN